MNRKFSEAKTVEDIRHAIETIPCDKCGGSGKTLLTSDYKGPSFLPCSCNNGVINRWDEFIEWHTHMVYPESAKIVLMDNKGITWDDDEPALLWEASADILTNPEYLKAAYLSFDEERK